MSPVDSTSAEHVPFAGSVDVLLVGVGVASIAVLVLVPELVGAVEFVFALEVAVVGVAVDVELDS